VYFQAARTINLAGAIDASGGEGDGGSVAATTGDDITITKSISVDSRGGGGFGGEITLRAGDDALDGIITGGAFRAGCDADGLEQPHRELG
jgi:hypothetical protein